MYTHMQLFTLLIKCVCAFPLCVMAIFYLNKMHLYKCLKVFNELANAAIKTQLNVLAPWHFQFYALFTLATKTTNSIMDT